MGISRSKADLNCRRESPSWALEKRRSDGVDAVLDQDLSRWICPAAQLTPGEILGDITPRGGFQLRQRTNSSRLCPRTARIWTLYPG